MLIFLYSQSMPNQILDLRNLSRAESKPHQSLKKEEGAELPELAGDYSLPRPTKELFEWVAYEYTYREHAISWFLTIGGMATLLVIIGIIARSYFFIAFVTLAFVVIVLYAKRKPQKITFALSKEGVRAGRKFYDFSGLKSFWIFEKGEEKELSLAADKTLAPFIHLPLGDADPQKIREVLSRFLPEEEHKELISDQVARGLGL